MKIFSFYFLNLIFLLLHIQHSHEFIELIEEMPLIGDVVESVKNAVFGYPVNIAIDGINTFCAEGEISDPPTSPDVRMINLQLRTKCKIYNYPLPAVKKLIKNPVFDVNKKSVIIAAGWMANANKSTILQNFTKAYSCRGGVNIITIDASVYLGTFYNWSAKNAKTVGKYIAKALSSIIDAVPAHNIHMMGLSLGSAEVAFTARYYYKITGRKFSRVTGFDPARPCFQEGSQYKSLRRGDAEFVDIIHSNPGGLGIAEALGDVDIYLNGLKFLIKGEINAVTSHIASAYYYMESLYPSNAHLFWGNLCSSFDYLNDHANCDGKSYILGEKISHNQSGIFTPNINLFSKDTTLNHTNCKINVCEN